MYLSFQISIFHSKWNNISYLSMLSNFYTKMGIHYKEMADQNFQNILHNIHPINNHTNTISVLAPLHPKKGGKKKELSYYFLSFWLKS